MVQINKTVGHVFGCVLACAPVSAGVPKLDVDLCETGERNVTHRHIGNSDIFNFQANGDVDKGILSMDIDVRSIFLTPTEVKNAVDGFCSRGTIELSSEQTTILYSAHKQGPFF